MGEPASGASAQLLFGDLVGKVAVVTGGARGLGFAMARALAGQGARVALLDLLPEVQDSAARLAAEGGGEAVGAVVDVTSPEGVDAVFTDVGERWDTPQVLVNAAGVAANAPAEEIDLGFWRRVFDVNVTGTLVPCQRFARGAFAAGRSGSIVNVSSMSAFVVNVPQRQATYNASKAAVDHLTRSLAVEWVGRGVRVNAIAPGYFLSDMTRGAIAEHPKWAEQWLAHVPAGRMGDPDDLAGLVVYLASDASSYVVGSTIVIDGGYSVV